jgi:hypothetical protein
MTQLTTWTEAEAALGDGGDSVESESALSFSLPRDLPFRKIFLHVESRVNGVVPSVTDFQVLAEVLLHNQGEQVAKLPASYGLNLAASTFMARSCCKVCSSATVPAGPECVELSLGKIFKGDTRQILVSPIYVVATADKLTFRVKGVDANPGQVTTVKVWIGVLSSQAQ